MKAIINKRCFKICQAVILSLNLIIGCLPAYAEQVITQTEVKEPNKPDENNAYIIFGSTPKMNKMSFEDGWGNDRYSVTYNEKIVYNGVEGRQVFVENMLYMRVDKDFASPEDRVFCITIDYWDYSGAGNFYIDYTIPDSTDRYGRIAVLKQGIVGEPSKWHRAVAYIDDASFRQAMDYGCDLRIVTNAFNAYSKIEIENLSKTASNNTEDFGIFNKDKAKTLSYLGFYKINENNECEPKLEEKLTRESALVNIIKSYGLEDEALNKNINPGFTDVSEESKPYIGLAKSMGVIKDISVSMLGANESITQKELVIMYLNLLGIKDDDIDNNAEKLAREHKLIGSLNFVFQMNKEATYDNFVALAVNALVINNVQTNKSALGIMFEQGKIDEDIISTNDKILVDWLLSNSFKIEPKIYKDELTGREYKTINLLGQSALKQYMTQQCWSTDNERFYFIDTSFRYFEYNTTTKMATYIDTAPYGYDYAHMVSPKNNLFYINKSKEIIKMNLDTYEKVKVGEIPKWQLSKAFMLQVNNNETKLSLEWKDTSGEFDSDYFSRLPILDLTTGEWDLRWVYGFDFSIDDWYRPNHPCINPTKDNLLFFAHEGMGVSDRIWILNTDTAEYYNVFAEKEYTKGMSGESNVHESWTFDGEYILTIKSDITLDGIPRMVGEGRLVMIRYDKTDKRYIPGVADLLHPASSPVTNRWIVSDTSYRGEYTDLYLIDSITGANYFLCRTIQTGLNPGHAHPHFSQDGNKIIFGLYGEDRATINIGWMDVSDIVNIPLEGGNYNLSETCDTFGYKGYEHYLDVINNNDGDIYRIPRGNSMYVNVKSSVIEEDNADAHIEVTFKNTSNLPIKLSYLRWEKDIGGRGKMVPYNYYIKRNSSGSWQTVSFDIDNICLGNMELLGSDFKLSGVSSDAIIKSVDVSAKKTRR